MSKTTQSRYLNYCFYVLLFKKASVVSPTTKSYDESLFLKFYFCVSFFFLEDKGRMYIYRFGIEEESLVAGKEPDFGPLFCCQMKGEAVTWSE